MKIVMALVAALTATPTWADSAADEAIRHAQVCSNDKAVKYSRETAESPQSIAEAAFDACESLWRVAVERLMDERLGGHGIPFTPEQIKANPSLLSEYVRLHDATENAYRLRGRREAEIKRLQVLVLETRANENRRS
ncbi:MAG TPA: hypothetical protein VIE66_08835 [Methylocella sp.]|jgi:hypothetical protein